MSDAYVAVARDALREFERRNEAALRPWDGELQSLEGVDVLLDEILQTPAN